VEGEEEVGRWFREGWELATPGRIELAGTPSPAVAAKLAEGVREGIEVRFPHLGRQAHIEVFQGALARMRSGSRAGAGELLASWVRWRQA
jgi:hypothetical protein